MSPNPDATSRHAFWRGAYRTLLVMLPRAMREKHGAAMMALFARDLERSAAHGRGAVWCAAAMGMTDLLGRGVYERVGEERAALTEPNLLVLRELATAFAMGFAALTTLMLWAHASRQLPGWRIRELPIGAAIEAIAFSIPFTAALTMPMAVFVAVLYTGTRARADGVQRSLQPGKQESRGTLRLAPLIVRASLLALFAFAWNSEVVPRANARLSSLYTGKPATAPNDRSMTLAELRTASQQLAQRRDVATNIHLREIAAGYSVEIHKKFAIAAACVVMALLAAGIARRAPHAGVGLQVLASLVVFRGYYIGLMGGESLADQYVVSPAPAMWGANLVALGLALLALRKGAEQLPLSKATLP